MKSKYTPGKPGWLRPGRVGFLCRIFLLSCVIGGLPLYAQTDAVFRSPLGAENRARFNEICAALSGYPVIKGTFEQTKTLSRLNRSLVSRGNFIIARDLGMVWETLKPFPSTLSAGRDYLLQSTPSGVKTRLDAKGNETFLRFADTISAVFSGNSQKLQDNFEVYFTATAKGWILGLIPSERAIRSFAERIILSGDALRDGTVIRTVLLYEKNGDSIYYALSDHRFPDSLSLHERSLFVLR
ncbi:MAG: outer membrane lipoprotein carrier protein LolA [Treponema sp.]|jgi:outer membrane lipoprotein-sorting protein|nr:outer membrane lipoprotein carrier protein LolA [Treponema sp.]